ncbi:glycosyltransferase [Mucilaginibacter sp. L196]|uniref:glycosyltransferase n=1 Tax=Mucilaginibacter sp. L196 TaxID=1641870 RepID=UPI00131C263B|nr:glycosyltransferase [Mucilaginibacter sp. L196]
MPAKLNIAIIADPEIPVPPVLYGGIERIINSLIIELKQKGHQVSLFAHPDSKTVADKQYNYPSTKQSITGLLGNTLLVSRLLFSKPDVIHTFGRLAYLSALLPTGIPKIMSYQREPTLSQIQKSMRIAAKGSLMFTGCSDYISNQIVPFAPAATVYNSVSMDDYTFCSEVKNNAPLVFLGRIEQIKGPHHAITIAKQTNRKLVIAGNIPDYAQAYFNEQIKPFIDGEQITYTGPVNDEQKNKLLGSAAAFLMPIEWNEPFGIVMAEALACGTPIIALKGGSTTEVVINGHNGFLCDDIKGMAKAVQNMSNIDRKNCRNDAERRFSSTVMTSAYENLYLKMINKN